MDFAHLFLWRRHPRRPSLRAPPRRFLSGAALDFPTYPAAPAMRILYSLVFFRAAARLIKFTSRPQPLAILGCWLALVGAPGFAAPPDHGAPMASGFDPNADVHPAGDGQDDRQCESRQGHGRRAHAEARRRSRE